MIENTWCNVGEHRVIAGIEHLDLGGHDVVLPGRGPDRR
jgi:hypothetical protein